MFLIMKFIRDFYRSHFNLLGDYEMVDMLLNRQASPNQATNEGETPLFAGMH